LPKSAKISKGVSKSQQVRTRAVAEISKNQQGH